MENIGLQKTNMCPGKHVTEGFNLFYSVTFKRHTRKSCIRVQQEQTFQIPFVSYSLCINYVLIVRRFEYLEILPISTAKEQLYFENYLFLSIFG